MLSQETPLRALLLCCLWVVGCADSQPAAAPDRVAFAILVEAEEPSEASVGPQAPPPRVLYRSTLTSTWSNPARNGSIDTPVPQLGELTRIIDSGGFDQPRFLVLSPDDEHVVALSDSRTVGWDLGSGAQFLRLADTGGLLVQTWASGVTHNGEEWDWHGRQTGAQLGTGSAFRQLNQLIGAKHVMGITSHAAIADRPYPVTVVTWSRYSGTADGLNTSAGLVREFAGAGTAAFGDDARAAIALSDGRLVVVAPERERAGYPQARIVVDHNYDFEPRELSIIEPNYYLVGKADDTAPAITRQDNARLRTVVIEPEQDVAAPGWGEAAPDSTLRVIGPEGELLWEVNVPFQVRQPAVRGLDGAVYLVGEGVAAVRGGKLFWRLPELGEYLATSDDEGRLLVSSGRRLLLISPDGELVQTLLVPEGERITTPAAISAAGWVYVGTDKGIYRARIGVSSTLPTRTMM